MTTETRKGYDVTREHRQQGCANPVEERVEMYKQLMASDNKWGTVINAIAELNASEEQARKNEKAH